jgi:hypothetical protein
MCPVTQGAPRRQEEGEYDGRDEEDLAQRILVAFIATKDPLGIRYLAQA